MPRPFAIYHYFLRHKRKSLALVAGLLLSMSIIAFVGGMVSSVRENISLARTYASAFSLIQPETSAGVPEGTVAQVKQRADVASVYTVQAYYTQAPLIVGDTTVPIFVMSADDFGRLTPQLQLKLVEGRLPTQQGELVLSRQMARAKHWSVGSVVGSDISENEAALPGRFTVVGILADQPWLAFTIRPLASNVPVDYLIVATPGHKAELEQWLDGHIAEPRKVRSVTASYLKQQTEKDTTILTVVLGMITGMVTVTNTVVTTLIGYIFVSQRRPEFALYLALGQSTGRVWRRSLAEMVIAVFAGWLLGMTFTTVLFWIVKNSWFDPHGMALTVINATVLLNTLVSPVVISLVMAWILYRMLSRYDYILAIEGRE